MPASAGFEKIVLITRKTRLEELIERFNTFAQAKFYIEHSGGDFSEYVAEHDTYQRSLDTTRRSLEVGLKLQVLDRELVPTYLFTPRDVIVTLGQDGLVANTAKYVAGQPILAVNPDPQRFDGILLPYAVDAVKPALQHMLAGSFRAAAITLAEARLNDGQRLLAFNDLFIGARSHTSARYRLRFRDATESQSSSGIIVSTGAGSTGWLSSVFNQTAGMLSLFGKGTLTPTPLSWGDENLIFVVREPFVSRHSTARIVAGTLAKQLPLTIESQMPSAGVVFSDGVEADRMDFNSGAVATIGIAPEKANLVLP